jgi:hypothetical protein
MRLLGRRIVDPDTRYESGNPNGCEHGSFTHYTWPSIKGNKHEWVRCDIFLDSIVQKSIRVKQMGIRAPIGGMSLRMEESIYDSLGVWISSRCDKWNDVAYRV